MPLLIYFLAVSRVKELEYLKISLVIVRRGGEIDTGGGGGGGNE